MQLKPTINTFFLSNIFNTGTAALYNRIENVVW